MKKFLLLLAFTVLLYNKKAVAQTCPIYTAPAVGTSWFEHSIDDLEIYGVASPYSGLNNNGTYLSVTVAPFWTIYSGMANPLFAIVGHSQNPELFACWIDYNHDGFYGTNENVFGQGQSPSAGMFPDITTAMIIPPSIPNGVYNVRFRVSYTDVQTSACNYTGNGETEDYLINIIQPGTALNFDGINDYCKRPVIANAANKFTLEARVSLTNTLSTGQMIAYNGDINNDGVGLFIGPNDSAVSIYYGGQGLFNTGYKLTRGVCATISAVINDSLLTCYVNGIETYSANTGVQPNFPSGNFTIGANTNGTNNFYGSIDEVRVWNRPLCTTEIYAHAQCQLIVKYPGPGLSAYYSFNQGVALDTNLTVTTLADSSVHGLNSTLYNFALLDSTSNWIYAPGTLSTTCGYYYGSTYTLSTTNNYICPGDSTTISVSGASTYTWSTGATTQSIIVKPATTTSYTVNAIDLHGCGSTDVEEIYIAPKTVSISPSSASICMGTTSTLTANGVATCTWMPAIATGTTAVVSPTVATTYSVTGITSNGCRTDTALVTVTVKHLPQVNAYALLPSICKNATDTILVSGGRYYSWYPSYPGYMFYNMVTTVPIGIVVSPSVTTSYTVIGTDSNNCANSYVVSVTVNQNPTANVVIAPTACGLCNGSATTTASGGAAPYHYVWNGSINNAVAGNLCAGTYTCIVTDTNNCRDTVHATISGSNILGLNASYTLTADATPHVWDVYPSVSGGVMPYSYLWAWGDGTTDTALYTSHTYSVANNYNVCLLVTDAHGCSNQYCVSDSLYRTSNANGMIQINVINGTMGINEVLNNEEALLIYPNPANTVINIQSKTYNAVCRVYDVLGNVVIESSELKMQNGNLQIDISNFAKGVYFIRVNNSTQKFIKE